MGTCCDLEVDINGEETFMVNKNILSSFSRKFCSLFGNLIGANGDMKVIFNEFPGGAYGFELCVQFCYNGGRMVITPSNVVLLYCCACFLEMESEDPKTSNLTCQIEEFLKGISFWTLSELLEALKQCQHLCPAKSCSAIQDRIMNNLIERINFPSSWSPQSCSSNTSSFQFSCDSSSINSCRNSSFWWFEHLVFFKIDLIDKVIKKMISQAFDHAIISKFLFYYQKESCLGAAQAEKKETIEAVINLLSLLDKRSLSCKDLFNLSQVTIRLNTSTSCKNKMESLLGSLLDQATVDYLILPSPQGRDHAYDVDLALRLAQIFVHEGSFGISLNRLNRVAKLMDLFLLEVAPDPHLMPSEFAALITVLPDTARESHDQLYLAIDLYLKVHAGLAEMDKMSICYALNHEKLSAELLRHLTRNLVFPSEAKPRAHVTKQSRIQSLLQENDHLRNFIDTVFHKKLEKNIDAEEPRPCNEVQKLRGNFHGMQSGIQLASPMKSESNAVCNVRYLPKLCSCDD
ncbi:hypothetical protein L6164_036480 [Bauhinia variegata]|uniref:Uncharacterized protein n=1 Tax=Bauhinia variegata TaxID=167791 RepID=A0ACB9KH39_BAUVA|nr:hypothetical protein L6164_036480 [Bauhinia variegata]